MTGCLRPDHHGLCLPPPTAPHPHHGAVTAAPASLTDTAVPAGDTSEARGLRWKEDSEVSFQPKDKAMLGRHLSSLGASQNCG